MQFTVKPVYKGQLMKTSKVAVIDRLKITFTDKDTALHILIFPIIFFVKLLQ